MDKTQLFSADNDDIPTLINRIKFILEFYSGWVSNENQNKENMYDIINNAFGTDTKYNLDAFLRDYYFVVREDNKKLVATAMYSMENEIKDKETETICDAEICRVIDRCNDTDPNSRHGFYCKEGADSHGVNRDISVQKMLDSLHMFMFHTFRLNPNEVFEEDDKQDNNESEEEDVVINEAEAKRDDLYNDKTTQKISNLITEATTNSKRFRRRRNTSKIYNKFMTMNQFENTPNNKAPQAPSPAVDDLAVYQSEIYGNQQLLLQQQQSNQSQCVTDQLCQKLHSKYKRSFKQFQRFLHDEEYDTDAIEDDLEFKHETESNLKRILLNKFETAALFVHEVKFEEDTKRNVYDPGLRLFYWPYYADKEEPRRLVRSGSSGGKSWEGNMGYKLKDWFIPKKYPNLKEELTQNETSAFSMNAYDEVIETASLKLNAYHSNPETQRIICKISWFEETYGIAKGADIGVHHIAAVLCYTNYTKHSYEFSQSFRRINPNETDESLKKRHREFHHWARALRECVECFGTEIDKSDVAYFYHGISRSMLIDSSCIKLCGPVSTTSDYNVAVSRFAGNGIVLQIPNDASLTPWSCSYWSCYSDEYEYLFIGGLAFFELSTIRDIVNMQRYDPLISAMTVFHYLVDGYYMYRKVTKKNARTIRSLVKEEENNTLVKSMESTVPIYFLSLFHHFLNKLEYVDINMRYMDLNDFKGGLRSTYYGFKRLVSIFCLNNNPFSLNYVLFLGLIPNAESVIIWRYDGGYKNYKKSVELNREFIGSITKAIVLETQCKQINIVNPSLAETYPSLEDFIKQQQEKFNKCGWKLLKNTTFKHPRRSAHYGVCSNTLLIQRL